VLALARRLADLDFEVPLAELQASGAPAPVAATEKHVGQECSLVGHVVSSGCLEGADTVLDLGAGRGCLSERLQQAAGTRAGFLLIDRDPQRARCRDAALRRRGRARRLVADLQHVRLDPALGRCVAVTKHLCGCATDFGLRCLRALDEDKAALGRTGPPTPLFFATCCHHRCTWEHYVNQAFVLRHGLSEGDFADVCALSHWATLQARPPEEAPRGEAREGLDWGQRRALGQRCKRFLDSGRLEWLRGRYATAALVQYTTLSVENRLLVAR